MSDAALTELARFAGAHAVAAFVALLLLVLLAVGIAASALQRQALPAVERRWPPVVYLLLHFALGFALLIAAGALFAEIAEALDADDRLRRLDQVFSDAVRQSVTPVTLKLFAAVTHFGDPATLTALSVVVALLLVVRGRRWLALGWVVAVAGNGLLNQTLKALFQRVRPLHDAEVAAAYGYSFPSGHTSGALVAYGMLAYLALRTLPAPWHLPAVLSATAVALATGASRVFLHVHFASDVLAGFASGSAWLATCIVSIESARRYRGHARAP